MSLRHAKFATLAERLIEKNGRTLDLKRQSSTPSDAAKPWRGGQATYAEEVDVIGVVVEYDEEEIDGDIIRRGDKRALVAVNSLPEVGRPDLTKFHNLFDGTSVYSIVNVSVIEPGAVRIMYDIQLRA